MASLQLHGLPQRSEEHSLSAALQAYFAQSWKGRWIARSTSFPIYFFRGFFAGSRGMCLRTWSQTSSKVLGDRASSLGFLAGAQRFPSISFPYKERMPVTTDTGREIVKLYVDSGPSWRVSGSTASFTYEIPGTQLNCPPGTKFAVSDAVVAHGWYPINSTNNRLHVRLRTSTSLPVTFTDHVVLLAEGAPSFSALATEATTKLSALGTSTFAVTWNPATFQFRFQQSGSGALCFMLFSDSRLKQYHFGGEMVANPRSANQILGILDPSAPSVGADYLGYTVLADYGTAVLLRVHSLRIICPQLGGSTLQENGSFGCIAKLPLELEVARESASPGTPWMPCGGRALKTLDIEITDEYGNLIELPESCPISFSICFADS